MDNRYAGMTVNERLYASGLWDKFYNAVERKDISTIISILKKVELKEESVKPVLDFFNLGNIKARECGLKPEPEPKEKE